MHRFTVAFCALATAVSLPLAAQTTRPATPRAGNVVAPARPASPGRATVPTVLPGTPENAFTTIQGNALDSGNRRLPLSPVRLRDARVGRIVDAQVTDKSGLFAFRAIDPGSYVVELVSEKNNSVLAASEVLNINAGESVTAIVKLPFRIPPLGGVLGHNAAQAAAITAAAAATGVLTQAATAGVSCEQLPCR